MARGEVSVAHKKFLIYASGVGCGYAGKPTNDALTKIQRDLNEVGQNVHKYRWMNVHNTMRYWLPYCKNPVRPRMCYRVALQRLTKGAIKVEDWDKLVETVDSSPWLPGQM